jgi:cardiolipin synthase
VGSSNLNAASLLGNWEMDVGVLDESLASQLEGLFLADLASSVEIVLPSRPVPPAARTGLEQVVPTTPLDPEGSLPERLERQIRSRGGGSTGWRIADFVRASSIFGDALAGHRPLGREDRTILGTVSTAVLVGAVLIAIFPHWAGWALATIMAWIGGTGTVRAFLAKRLARKRDADELHRTLPPSRSLGDPPTARAAASDPPSDEPETTP